MFKSALRDAALILLGMGIAIGITSYAQKAEFSKTLGEKKVSATADLGYADCRFTPSPDGQWYQKDQDHSSRYKAGCGTVGVSFYPNPSWTFGIHYVQLGRTEVNALAIAFPGDDRAKQTADINPMRADCAPSFKEGCLYHWHTGSFVRGVNFSFSQKLGELGPVRFDAKVGAYVHKLSAHAVVQPVGCNDSCGWRVQVDQEAVRVTPMWGAVVRWKFLYASWESYESIGDHTPVIANVKGRVEVKTIGVRIPI